MPDITPQILADLDTDNFTDQLNRRLSFDRQIFTSPILEEITQYQSLLSYDDSTSSIEFDIREIERQTFGFVFIGLRLKQIFYRKRYLQRFASVKEFCQKALGKTLAYAKRLIKAAEVVVELARAGFDRLPQNESQVRPLTKLEMWPDSLNPEDSPLCQKWAEILESSPDNHPITADFVASIVDGDKEKKKQIRTNQSTWEKLEKMRIERGFPSVEKLLEAIANGEDIEPELPQPGEAEPQNQEIPILSEPIELKIRWLEKVRDSFLSFYSKSEEDKLAINNYLNYVWLAWQQVGYESST